MTTWLMNNNIDLYTTIIGTLFTLLGLGYTIYLVSKAKKASEAAKDAASETKNHIQKTNAISEMSSVLAQLKELKAHHRSLSLEILPERYAAIKECLIRVRNSDIDFEKDQIREIQYCINHLTRFEGEVGSYLIDNSENHEAKTQNILRIYKFIISINNKLVALNEQLIYKQ